MIYLMFLFNPDNPVYLPLKRPAASRRTRPALRHDPRLVADGLERRADFQMFFQALALPELEQALGVAYRLRWFGGDLGGDFLRARQHCSG